MSNCLLVACALDQREAATVFRKGSRLDLAEKEESEASLLAAFFPPPLTTDEVERFLSEAVSLVVTTSAHVGVTSGHGGVNTQALVGKSLKAFWAIVPPSHSGSIPNEKLSRRARTLIEAKLK